MLVNKQIEILKYLIKRQELPSFYTVDWVKIYEYWLCRNDPKQKIEKKTNKIVTEEKRYYQRASTMNYRARKKGVDGIVTPDDLRAIMIKYYNKCNKCSKTEHLVFDHIRPHYNGGTNTPDNIQVLCRICNMEKGVGER